MAGCVMLDGNMPVLCPECHYADAMKQCRSKDDIQEEIQRLQAEMNQLPDQAADAGKSN